MAPANPPPSEGAVMSLKTELDLFLSSFRDRVPPEVADLIGASIEEQIASGLANRALKPGGRAPEVVLPNADGRVVDLARLLARGPVIVSFYRGGWCRLLQPGTTGLPGASARDPGRRRVSRAISPQTPDASLSTAEKNALGFEVLSDIGSEVANRFGITFALKHELRALYTRLNHPLPEVNGAEDWRLPIPPPTLSRRTAGSCSHISTRTTVSASSPLTRSPPPGRSPYDRRHRGKTMSNPL
jgi:peroxiredoxin